jgi:anti-sigma-K factor RskA
MRYRDKPELQDKLAAEYVLGTLRGRARLRFQAWLREDAALRRTVTEWEARLAPMAEALPERRPPGRVWWSLQSRIAAAAPAASSAAAPAPGFWDSLSFWRGWGLVATGCAAALVGALALRAPQVVEVPVVQKVEVPSARMQPAYIAMLSAPDSKGDKIMFVAYATRKSDELWVKRMELPPVPDQHSYELWAMPARPGEPAKSLGLLPQGDKSTMKLPGVADETLAETPALAITLEPAGGAKDGKSSGIVLAKGDCLRFW